MFTFTEETFGAAKGGYTYSDDMQTTNLYLGNLNPKVSLLTRIAAIIQPCQYIGPLSTYDVS